MATPLKIARRNMRQDAEAAAIDPTNTQSGVAPQEGLPPKGVGNVSMAEANKQTFQDFLAGLGQPGQPGQAVPQPAPQVSPQAIEAASAVLNLAEGGQLPPLPEGYRMELQAVASGQPPAPPSASAPPMAPPEVAPLPAEAALRDDALFT